MNSYQLILNEFEVEPSDILIEYKNGERIEIRDKKYQYYNLVALRIYWRFYKKAYTRGWSRKKKRKINNRLIRYFRNYARKLNCE